jgi:hypothetical protein
VPLVVLPPLPFDVLATPSVTAVPPTVQTAPALAALLLGIPPFGPTVLGADVF